MAGKVMVLYDTEEEYARLMSDFLRKNKSLPWELHTYTNVEDLFREEGFRGDNFSGEGIQRERFSREHFLSGKEEIEILVVAERAFSEELEQLHPRRLVVLGESGIAKHENVAYVDKYQEAGEVLRFLLGIYMEDDDAQLPGITKTYKTIFIGNYSPVRRCMQTSFAVTMSQLLARDHPTLYLSFEHYAGISELLPDMQTLDLADLLYFLNAEKDKFRLRLQTILKHRGGLSYIPPMKAGQNLLAITAQEWMGLLRKLEELGEYEYVILDLSESMQGLFEILRLCTKVYTLTREDRIARSKLLQYEQVLALYEYEDVLDKTKRLSVSHIRRIPEELDQMTKGDLANLVRGLLRELEE